MQQEQTERRRQLVFQQAAARLAASSAREMPSTAIKLQQRRSPTAGIYVWHIVLYPPTLEQGESIQVI